MTNLVHPTAARALTLAAATLALATACQTMAPAPLAMEDTVQVTATVEKIDMAKRLLTLKNPDGDVVTVEVGPAVVNLPQVRVGDKVIAQYQQSVLAQITSRGQPNGEPSVAVAADVAEVGARPGGAVGIQKNVPVTIASVDKKNNIVSFYTSDGIIRAIPVQRPQAQAFIQQLKPGDNVDVTFTEALAISVAPAQ